MKAQLKLVSEQPIYRGDMPDAPKWAYWNVKLNWPKRSSFRLLGVKERQYDFAIAAETKVPVAECGQYFAFATVLSCLELRKDPKPLVELAARDAEIRLRDARRSQRSYSAREGEGVDG